MKLIKSLLLCTLTFSLSSFTSSPKTKDKAESIAGIIYNNREAIFYLREHYEKQKLNDEEIVTLAKIADVPNPIPNYGDVHVPPCPIMDNMLADSRPEAKLNKYYLGLLKDRQEHLTSEQKVELKSILAAK